MEADRRHTTTGFKCHKSCLQSCLDLSELVVDCDAEALKRARCYMDVARPSLARDRGFDGLSQIAGGAERAPRHDELCDPASPSLFAVLPQDSLDLGAVVIVDDARRRELGGGVHPHVERPFGAEAEPPRGVVDLSAGETEVEEDQVRLGKTVLQSYLAKLGKPTVNQYRRRPEPDQRRPSGLDRRGIAVDPEQPAARRDPLQDLAGMARLPEGAVDRDRARPGLEQLYYLL
jgi:hypothetical protein